MNTDTLTEPQSKRTICLLLKEDKILLGLKKRGFGQGKWMGIGGKVDEGETEEHAAIREMEEETTVIPQEIKKVAILNYFFPEEERPDEWNQQIHAFFATSWKGDPQEMEEVKPTWFSHQEIPYVKMWDDAKYWLPEILAGKKLIGYFSYDKNMLVKEYAVTFTKLLK